MWCLGRVKSHSRKRMQRMIWPINHKQGGIPDEKIVGAALLTLIALPALAGERTWRNDV